jgi:hypothetical protein
LIKNQNGVEKMGISFEDALKAQKAIEDKLLKDPNVVSIGVFEETNHLGQKSGNYSIKVGVISAELYQNTLEHGESIIPREYTFHSENGSREVKHVKINVVKTGQINALLASRNDFPSALDDIPAASLQTSDDHTSRERPSLCGQSIGHPSITAGTIGLLVEYIMGPNIGKAYILSNNHVLAANNSGFVGDPIVQPGPHDLGNVNKDTIASLHRWVPLSDEATNYVDAAIAEVTGGLHWNKFVSPFVKKIGSPGELVDAEMGMDVEKAGRTTGYTQGEVISVNQTVKVNYGKVGVLIFKNQICTTSMSKGGDSGSCLFERGTQRPVGLLFAGHESETFHNPIKSVLSSLSSPWVNKYPSGKTHTFAKDHSLSIIRRNFSTGYLNSFYPSTRLTMTKSIKTHLPLVKRGMLFTSIGLFAINRTCKTLQSQIVVSSYNRTKRR